MLSSPCQLWRPPCVVVKNYKQFMRLGCLPYWQLCLPPSPLAAFHFLLHQADNMQRMPSAFAFAVNCVQRWTRGEWGEGTTCSRIALQLLEQLPWLWSGEEGAGKVGRGNIVN